MKKTIILFWLFVVFTGTSCVVGDGAYDTFTPEVLVHHSEQEEGKSRADNRRKRRTSYRANRGNRCEDDDRCFDICEDLYNADGAIDECGELRTTVVEEMEEIIEDLRDDDVTVRDLERYDEDIFDEMLAISSYPWVNAIRRRVSRTSHAKTILSWIASNINIFTSVRNYDGGSDFSTDYKAYEGFAYLLNEAIGGSGEECDNYCEALGAEIIGSGRTFAAIVGGSFTTVQLGLIFSELPEDLSGSSDRTCDTGCTYLGVNPGTPPLSPTDGDICRDHPDCWTLCGSVFAGASNDDRRHRCGTYTVAAINRLEEVDGYLKAPRAMDLELISQSDLDFYLSFDVEFIISIFDGYADNRNWSSAIAVWIAENEGIASLIGRNDNKDGDVLKSIFCSTGENIPCASGLEVPISRGDNFIDLIVKEGNEEAFLWVHEFMDGQDYCALDLSPDTRQGLASFDDFLDDISGAFPDLMGEQKDDVIAGKWEAVCASITGSN